VERPHGDHLRYNFRRRKRRKRWKTRDKKWLHVAMPFLRRKRWEIHFIVAVIFKRCMQLQTSQATHIAEGMAPFHVIVANIVAVIFNHCYRWMSLRRLVDSSHIVAVIFKCRKHFKRRLV